MQEIKERERNCNRRQEKKKYKTKRSKVIDKLRYGHVVKTIKCVVHSSAVSVCMTLLETTTQHQPQKRKDVARRQIT